MVEHHNSAWESLQKSNTFDKSSGAPIIENQNVSRAIAKTFPAYKTDVSLYFSTWLHFAVYTATFVLSSTQQIRAAGNPIAFLWSPFWAWSLFGILMTGHEAEHNTFAPKNSSLGWMNNVMSWLCWDMLFLSGKQWNLEHNGIHHKDAGGPRDGMHLSLKGFLHEFYSLIINVCIWLSKDLKRFFSSSTDPIEKLLLGSGILCRFVVWGCVGFYPFLVNFVVFVNVGNYLGLLAHAQPCRSKGPPPNYFVHQLRESWDFFPHSSLASFFFLGLNAHATHHIFPYIPRSLHSLGASLLEEHFPDEYRKIDQPGKLMHFYINRAKIL